MRRQVALVLALLLTLSGASGIVALAPAAAAPPPSHSPDNPKKLNLLGVWAHPDDDTSIIDDCGVWHQLYGITCGIIMMTRGEGGGNAVGLESGPALGLRRENEDRAAHYRSGTVDVFNLDRVDFYYNTSAPLTEQFWDHTETLRRVTRIIRMTQPDVLVGFSPSGSGHGNHQYAGRMIWEGAAAAADPTMFPEQLTGPNALETWQVRKITSGGSTQGSGGSDGPHCTTGFTPSPTNVHTVTGVWTGYDSPELWPTGNVQGMPAGTPKTWAQVGREGNRAYPTQSRMMHQGLTEPSCNRMGVAQTFVPMQPNSSPLAGRDEALFFGASLPDPGGMPLGSLLYVTFDRFFNVAGQPFEVTVHARSGAGTLPAGEVALTLPDGWTAEPAVQTIGPIPADSEATATFTVTPGADAAERRFKIAADLTTGDATGYTEGAMEIVGAVEGRLQRWGNFAEFDQWAAANTFVAGRSGAVTSIGAGETVTVPVVVHNHSTEPQSGEVTLDLPDGFTADATSKPYTDLPGGADTTVTFEVTSSAPDAPGGVNQQATITTTYGSDGAGSEQLTFTVVPTTTIAEQAAAPTLDAVESAGEYSGPALDISRRWEGQACNPDGVDCGDGSYAKVTRVGEDLYLFIHVVDETQSFPVTPEGCWAHWLADSVEILLDPRGDAVDTSTTFKMGVFPFTDDPSGSAGNGVNGPCWTRDADNHQGYSSGPLADTVPGAPNAAGMEVASSAVLNDDRTYEGGAYDLEVKIPLDILPAAVGPTSAPPTGEAASNDVDPTTMGLNITPYDSDTQDHTGQTRLAWSPFGSQQSEPYRWGNAYLAGYAPPDDSSPEPDTPIIPDTALKGIDSPQTIWQSAQDGVPISGMPPSDGLDVDGARLGDTAVEVELTAAEAGTAHVYLWQGLHGMIPVWLSSCAVEEDPLRFSACDPDDGGIPPWGTDMGGHVVADVVVDVTPGSRTVTIPVDAEGAAELRAAGSVLVGFESEAGGAAAFDLPLAEASATLDVADHVAAGSSATATAMVTGTAFFPGTPTGTVTLRVDGAPVGGAVALDDDGSAELTVPALAPGAHDLGVAYSGDGDYVPGSGAEAEVWAYKVCASADPRPTVVIGGVDSGVPNRATDGGCAINDVIEDEQPWPSTGRFVQHLHEVMAHLRDDGDLATRDWAALTRAALRSGIGRPARPGR